MADPSPHCRFQDASSEPRASVWRWRVSAVLTGIGAAGLATTLDAAVWVAVGQPMMPIGLTAILASCSGITLAVAYWLRPSRVQQ